MIKKFKPDMILCTVNNKVCSISNQDGKCETSSENEQCIYKYYQEDEENVDGE